MFSDCFNIFSVNRRASSVENEHRTRGAGGLRREENINSILKG
jgi:hypothetical protein